MMFWNWNLCSWEALVIIFISHHQSSLIFPSIFEPNYIKQFTLISLEYIQWFLRSLAWNCPPKSKIYNSRTLSTDFIHRFKSFSIESFFIAVISLRVFTCQCCLLTVRPTKQHNRVSAMEQLNSISWRLHKMSVIYAKLGSYYTS